MSNTFAKPGASTTTIPVETLTPEQPAVSAPNPTGYSPLAVVSAAPGALVPVPRPAPVLANDDEIGLRDIKLPTLNIVQGVGELVKAFEAGQIILAQERPLCDAPDKRKGETALSEPAVTGIVLGFLPNRFAEKVSQKPGEQAQQGLICNTEQEAYAVGGTTSYKEAFVEGKQVKRYFQTLSTALLLVKAPPAGGFEVAGDELDSAFPLTDESGDHWQFVAWNMKGTAFTHGAKPLKTARKLGWLRLGYASKLVAIHTKLTKAGTNLVYAPYIKNAGDTTPAQREFAAQVLQELFGPSVGGGLAREPKALKPLESAAPATSVGEAEQEGGE